jgi:hypothetical protein
VTDDLSRVWRDAAIPMWCGCVEGRSDSKDKGEEFKPHHSLSNDVGYSSFECMFSALHRCGK